MTATQYITSIGSTAGYIGEALQSQWLIRTFLDSLVPNVILYRYGTHPNMPLSTSKVARWLIVTRISPDASPTATTEGAEPTTARSADLVNYDATIAEYADVIYVSSLLDLTAINGTVQKLVEAMAQLAAEQVNNVIAVELDNHALAASVDVSESAIADTTTAAIFDTDELFKAESLKRIASKLKSGFARPCPYAYTGRKFCLVASRRIFFEFCGDSAAMGSGVTTGMTAAIIQALRLNTPSAPRTPEDMAKGYFDSGDTHPGVMGVEVTLNISDRTVARTVNSVTTTATQDNFVFGDQAFGLVDLNSNLAKPAIIRKIPGPTTVSQPTNAQQSIGYRVPFAAKLFNASTMMLFGSV